MFYHIFYPLVKYNSIFNIFQYITFRALGAFITAILLSFIFAPKLIKDLKKNQITERINLDLPTNHKHKAGTPTMGGLIIGIALLISVLLWNNLTNNYVLMAGLVVLWLGGLGFLDDYLKNIKRVSEGLVEKYKISGQIVLGLLIAFTLYFGYEKSASITEITLPFFKNTSFSLGILFIPFVALFITFYSNAVNLTDGLDGLASGSIAIVAFGLGIIAYIKGNAVIADYLQIEFIKNAGELAVFITALIGAMVGFLWYNIKPAGVFMGDTGALSMGGLIAVLAILLKSEIFFMIISFLFLVEAMSSLLQRYYFKYTRLKTGEGKRLFRCAPLHHHYEMKGWTENQIVVRFWIIMILLTTIGLITLKIR
ncbi:MAG: phospho-N-acetylmuramoyl-pentapeptide-transferase [Candidatus Cloacimonadota bacterium]|nr:phospho-N-acetylmuramoyl-pentapeptide-transferase [Candidatus Cloacimonadota bacterium]